MNRNTVPDNMASNDGEYVVKKSKKLNIIAFILCVLASFSLWLYVVNTQDADYTRTVAASVVCVGGESADREFVFELSSKGVIEVSGPASSVDMIYNARIEVAYADYKEGDVIPVTIKSVKFFDNMGKIVSSKDISVNVEDLSVTVMGVKEK